MQPDWKRFEELAASIQQELAPEATVQANARIQGRRSQVMRQIDVWVEERVGQFLVQIAIDCKDYGRPVDVKDVEEVIGLVEDVAANKGAIIAAKGFTAAAKKRGTDAGLDLFRLVDVSEHKWRTYVTVPALTRDFRIQTFQFQLKWTGDAAVPLREDRNFAVFRKDGSLLGYASNLILDRWEDGSFPHEKGHFGGVSLTKEPMYIKGVSGLVEASITFKVSVEEDLHFGQIPLVELRGFRNEVTGATFSRGFTTGDFDFNKIGREWQKIESVDQLAVKPLIELAVSSTYQRYNPIS